jgi:hypothetical protein
MEEGTIMESRDATFFEDEFPMKNVPSTSSHDFVSLETPEPENIVADESHENILEEDNGIVTRKSKRHMGAKSFGDDYIIYLVDDTPKTIEEAYSSPDADLWKEAVQNEMDSIMCNGTWEVVDRPYGCKPVGCKWVFKRSSGLMVLLRSIKRGLLQKAIPKKKGKIILILIHL